MAENLVETIVEVTNEPQATEAYKRLRDEQGRFISATQASAQTLSAAAQSYERDLLKAGVAARRAREEAIKFQQTSGESAREAAKQYEFTEKEIDKLRLSLKATREEALALQAQLAKQGNDPASRAAADLARRAGRGIESLDADPSSALRVSALSRAGTGTLGALKDEAKGFNAEIEKSGNLLTSFNRRLPGLGSPIGSLVRGLFGGLLIVEAVRGVVELVEQYRELKRADEEARRQLIQSSVDTGANIRQEIEQVNALKETYHGLSQAILDSLEAEARRAAHAPVTQQSVEEATRKLNPTTENDATRALQTLPDDVIARAALNAAIARGLRDQETLDKNKPSFFGSLFGAFSPSYRERAASQNTEATAAAARKALQELISGNPQALTGLSDAEAQARFAGVVGKLPDQFTEEERRLARLNALLQAQGAAYISAADAALAYKEALGGKRATAPGAGPEQAQSDANAAAEENARAELERLARVKKGQEDFKKTQEEFWKDSEKWDAENAREAEDQKRRYEQVRSAVASARDAAREFLSGELVKGDRDNPMIALFIRLQNEVEETRKRFLTFGSDFADMMARIKQAEIEQEIAVARLQSRLSSLRAEQEARRLALPLVGLTGPQERALAVFDARISAATSGVQGAVTGEALRAGFTRINPAYLAGREFDELRKLEKSVEGLAGGRDALDAAYKSLFQSLPDDLKQSVARNPALRDTFAGAFGRDADRAQREIRDQLARERAGNLIQSDARELLAAVSTARGVGRDEQLKEFLAIAGTLSEKELTPDLRVARAQFLQESSRRDSQRERQGEERAARLDDVMKKLGALISQKGIKVDGPPIGINLNVKDGLDVDKSLTGEAPRPEQVQPGEYGGFRY